MTAALEAAYDALTEVADGVIVRPMLTIDSAIDLWLGDLARRRRATRTRDRYGDTLDKFCDRFPPHWDVAKVTTEDCEHFLDLWSHRKSGTQANVYAALNGLFRWLYLTRKIKQNPMEFVPAPRRQAPEDLDVTTIESTDVPRLLAAAVGDVEILTMAVLAYLGPRRRAVATLRLSDYSPMKRQIRFREKGGQTIWKPVPDELADIIDARYDAIRTNQYQPDDPYLIPPEHWLVKAGERDDRIIWRTVRRVAERAGVKTHVHALRAAFAVYYLEKHPGDLEALQALMGHKKLDTTQVYLRKLNRQQAMERVRGLSWGDTGGAPVVPIQAAVPADNAKGTL